MIRFVDLTDAYWLDGGSPVCAFLDTVTDTFLKNGMGTHLFMYQDEIDEMPPLVQQRLRGLIPDGFFAAENADASITLPEGNAGRATGGQLG